MKLGIVSNPRLDRISQAAYVAAGAADFAIIEYPSRVALNRLLIGSAEVVELADTPS
jgi:hypothetical protein